MNKKPSALDEFILQKMAIDQSLKLLQALSNEHFNVAPDEVKWADAGSLAHVAALLKEITNFIGIETEQDL